MTNSGRRASILGIVLLTLSYHYHAATGLAVLVRRIASVETRTTRDACHAVGLSAFARYARVKPTRTECGRRVLFLVYENVHSNERAKKLRSAR